MAGTLQKRWTGWVERFVGEGNGTQKTRASFCFLLPPVQVVARTWAISGSDAGLLETSRLVLAMPNSSFLLAGSCSNDTQENDLMELCTLFLSVNLVSLALG